MLNEIHCTPAPDKQCTLVGDKLFLLDSVSNDLQFVTSVNVPYGFIARTLAIPAPPKNKPGAPDDSEDFLEQSTAMNLYGEGLIYHTAELPEETEVAGQLKLTLWMTADVSDVDLSARVTEIRPDGRSIFLADDMMRASYRQYRDMPDQRRLLIPGEPTKIEFTSFPWFARRFAKGSRLRVIVRALNTSSWEKNYNRGKAVEDALAKDARTAHITILHDAEHPSVLEVPIGN